MSIPIVTFLFVTFAIEPIFIRIYRNFLKIHSIRNELFICLLISNDCSSKIYPQHQWIGNFRCSISAIWNLEKNIQKMTIWHLEYQRCRANL